MRVTLGKTDKEFSGGLGIMADVGGPSGSSSREGNEQAKALDKMTDLVRLDWVSCRDVPGASMLCGSMYPQPFVGTNLPSCPLAEIHPDPSQPQVEEREMKKVDQSKVQAAMAELAQQEREKQEATRQRCVSRGRVSIARDVIHHRPYSYLNINVVPLVYPFQCRERELAAVKVEASDVELIAAEFEIEKKAAERHLREAGGDVKATLTSLAMQA